MLNLQGVKTCGVFLNLGFLLSTVSMLNQPDVSCHRSYSEKGPVGDAIPDSRGQKYTWWWFQHFFYFHPYLGKIPIWTNIFRWVESTNQPVCLFSTNKFQFFFSTTSIRFLCPGKIGRTVTWIPFWMSWDLFWQKWRILSMSTSRISLSTGMDLSTNSTMKESNIWLGEKTLGMLPFPAVASEGLWKSCRFFKGGGGVRWFQCSSAWLVFPGGLRSNERWSWPRMETNCMAAGTIACSASSRSGIFFLVDWMIASKQESGVWNAKDLEFSARTDGGMLIS